MRVKSCSGYGDHWASNHGDPLDIPIVAFRDQLQFTRFVAHSLDTIIYLYCSCFFQVVNDVNL